MRSINLPPAGQIKEHRLYFGQFFFCNKLPTRRLNEKLKVTARRPNKEA